ncbi:hypothetical protein GCM10027418_11480 [Mariniluteicoccus endophyticus]
MKRTAIALVTTLLGGAAAVPTIASAVTPATTIAAVGDSITLADLPKDSKNRAYLSKVNTEKCWGWLCNVSRTADFQVNDGLARGGGMSTHFLREAKRYDRSDYLLLMGGTNDVASQAVDPRTHSNDRVIERYQGVIKASGKPANRVIISAIAPFNDQATRRNAYNRELEAFAKRNGYHYVDPWKGLDANGRFASKSLHWDGIHPSVEGHRMAGTNMVNELRRVTGGKGPTTPPKPPTEKPDPKGFDVLRPGDRGDDVKGLQMLLNSNGARLAVDGSYGPATTDAVKDYQRRHRLEVDGHAGPKTLAAITPTLKKGARGESVKALQTTLRARGHALEVDGSFGPATEGAVRAFQKKERLSVDGSVGDQTWAALLR